MIEIQDNSLPTPAIVITSGTFAMTTVSQIRDIYLRSDPRRKQVTYFFSLREAESGDIEFASLDSAIAKQNNATDENENSSKINRQAVFQNTVKKANALRIEIEQALYNILSHEVLIKAGWREEYNIPVNIYLLADIKDPFAAGVLLPVCCLLSDIANRSNLFTVHALLNCAVFPRINDDLHVNQDVEVYTFLTELDDLFQDKSTNREKLTEILHCETSTPLGITAYLFDCHKEGSYVVKDNEQMQVMVGNALLALMEKDIARLMAAMHDPFEVAGQQSFYNSIGAIALIYDPESLQSTCAKKVGGEFLEDVILADRLDAQIAAQEAKIIENELGDLRAWLENCIFQLPPEIGQVRIDPDTAELSILLSDLKLSGIDYEHFQNTGWVQQLSDYAKSFEKDVAPRLSIVISTNGQQVEEILTDHLALGIDALPTKPNMYPGGLPNAIRTLKFLSDYLEKEKNKTQELVPALENKRLGVDQDLENRLGRIQEIITNSPKLPKIISIMPKFIRIWAAPIFYAHRYGKKILQLQNLKDESISLLQVKYSIQIQCQALLRIGELIEHLIRQIEIGSKDYKVLEEKVVASAKQLPSEWPIFPLGQPNNGWDNVFRTPVVDVNLAEWAFKKYHPSFEKWTYEFLAKESPFTNWRKISSETVIDWLSTLGEKAYESVWNITIDEVFGLRKGNTPGFTSNEPLSPKIIANSLSSCFPLLRPDFDEVGGSRISTISAHGLIGQPGWKNFNVVSQIADLSNLDLIYTGDPYTGLFLKVRHSVPLRSLTEMIRLPRYKIASLSKEDKLKYSIVHTQGDGIQPKSTDNEDPTNSDLVHKVFNWKFKPKGSGVEVEQTLSIDISKSRFEHFRRIPRFNGEWNRYAEEEMPEIRSLAMEFQRLHSSQNWSTYNQAFNVLKFVQSCVPYAYDKDTTGHSDWARYPIETIVEGIGDCEDLAILCAAIIARLGFQTVLLLYPSHLAFGVAGADKLKGDYIVEPTSGKRYFYGEATADGWHLGAIPGNYKHINPDKTVFINILINED